MTREREEAAELHIALMCERFSWTFYDTNNVLSGWNCLRTIWSMYYAFKPKNSQFIK